MPLSSDSELAITKSVGSGVIGFAEAFNQLKPELVLLLGDRFEAYSSAIAAFLARLPIAHLYGGELTEGLIDDAIRHSITKMSLLHFVSTEKYRQRVIQLGEAPNKVFLVGALGIDNIKRTRFIPKVQLENELKFKLGNRTAIVTFHPVTLKDRASTKRQFKELLGALVRFKDLKVIFTKPNADMNGKVISRMIDSYVKTHPSNTVAFTSMGRVAYLSALKYVDVMIGNSSSGIIEFPSFGKPTIDIGERQQGRVRAASVISCAPKEEEVVRALEKSFSRDFRKLCRNVKNPYGKGDAANRIMKILKQELNKKLEVQKAFYDLIIP